jgi:DNA-binding transcriptional MerR regulator/methylmalonyl-CoA mutase cobalamin-binding subunit
MKNLLKYKRKICTIKYVAEKTGLSPHLIRIWERRYNAIVPDRTETNRRLFSELDVLRLQLLKKATDAGHNISQVANLSSDELLRLINNQMIVVRPNEIDPTLESDENYFYKSALNCVMQLNGDGLKNALEQASVLLTKLTLINGVIVPLCTKMGALWRSGKLKIINEHMATPIIRSVLWNLLNAIKVSRIAPRIVIATPLNHRHDIGALAIAIIAREAGWRSLFFGSNLPADEIAAAVNRTKARAVALSITFSLDYQMLVEEIKMLRRYLSSDIAIFIGGQGASNIIDHPDINNVQLLRDLESLNTALDNLLNCDH